MVPKERKYIPRRDRKVCDVCEHQLPLDHFYPSTNTKDKLGRVCKACNGIICCRRQMVKRLKRDGLAAFVATTREQVANLGIAMEVIQNEQAKLEREAHAYLG